RLRVAHAHFQRVKEWMQPDVPPDCFRIINAAGLYQQLAVIFVLGKALERIGNACAWKTLEHFQSITLQARVLADPERRVHRERVNVGQKIACLVHHVDGDLAIWDTNMNVQSENKVRARQLLHVLDDFAVALALSNELIAPVRKWMRTDGGNL